MDARNLQLLKKIRLSIARGVRDLRLQHSWTQNELSRRLGLSRARLSQVERGDGSFSAEQLVVLLQVFNVSLSDLVPQSASAPDAELQNALARLGAVHLLERDDIPPADRDPPLDHLVRDALVSASPRLITALGPVLVQHIDELKLNRLNGELAAAGLERRLGWVVENVAHALTAALEDPPSRQWARKYRRALLVLETFLSWAAERIAAGQAAAPDVLDPAIRSQKTLAEARAASSPISKRWGIVTALQPEDFLEALRAARADR